MDRVILEWGWFFLWGGILWYLLWRRGVETYEPRIYYGRVLINGVPRGVKPGRAVLASPLAEPKPKPLLEAVQRVRRRGNV